MGNNSATANIGKVRIATCLLAVALISVSNAAKAQGTPGTNLTDNCSECHGSDGLGFKPGVPHLNGQPEALLGNMINAFREGTRPTKVKMHRDITAADVTPLARHYAQQKAQRPKSATTPELVTRGEATYLKRCADCHLDNGRESDKEAPLMAAQDLGYLVAQTLAFKTGERKFPYLMDGAYKDLSDEDLTAVAHFFAAQDQIAPQQARKRRR